MNSYYEEFKDKSVPELNTTLIKACLDGEFEKVKYLLTSPELKLHAQAQCHDGDYDLSFPLKQAAFNGNFEIVKYLLTSSDLKEHADIHFENDDAFYMACIRGHLDIVTYMLTSPELKEHADITIAGGGDPLCGPCIHGHLEVLDYLLTSQELKKHADITIHDDAPLRMACLGGHVKIIEYIFNLPGYITQERVNFALTEACAYGRTEIVKFLLSTDNIQLKPNIHTKKDNAFGKLLELEEGELLRYFIFDLNIKKSRFIKKYLQENSNKFTQQVSDWFKLRELNKQLNKEFDSDILNNSKRLKI
jgi:ankyrin repeat protein